MTALVDPSLVEWLRADALFVDVGDAGVTAGWGADAVETRIFSPYVNRADALAEAARQLAWTKGPLVTDVHVVPGRRIDLYLRWIEIVVDQLDYAAGVAAFVIDAAEQDDGTTQLTVLRPL